MKIEQKRERLISINALSIATNLRKGLYITKYKQSRYIRFQRQELTKATRWFCKVTMLTQEPNLVSPVLATL